MLIAKAKGVLGVGTVEQRFEWHVQVTTQSVKSWYPSFGDCLSARWFSHVGGRREDGKSISP